MASRASRVRSRVALLLAMLVAIAAAALAAGLVAQSAPFWTAAALVFAAAFSGLVAYAARELGVFAETAQLLSHGEGLGAAGPDRTADDMAVEEEKHQAVRDALRGEVAFEISREMKALRGLSGFLEMDHPFGAVEAEKSLGLIGASARHGLSARALGQLFVETDPQLLDPAKAEECFIKAVAWGDLVAAYSLGHWHAEHHDLAHDRDWWLSYAHDGSALAAYLAAQAEDAHETQNEFLPAVEAEAREAALKGDFLPPLAESRVP